MGQIKEGDFGLYYEYLDQNNKTQRINIKSKYLTEDLLEKIVQGQTVSYYRKNNYGLDKMKAYLGTHTTKDGRERPDIKIELVESFDDRKIIQKYKTHVIPRIINGSTGEKANIEAQLKDLTELTRPDLWNAFTKVRVPMTQNPSDPHIYAYIIIYRIKDNEEDSIRNPECQALIEYYKYLPGDSDMTPISFQECRDAVRQMEKEEKYE